jgi:RNA polymerase sigma-70 factor (ECF subfamily)
MSALLGHAPVTRPTEPAELTRYLYEKYGQRVFTFCYSRLRNREEAQDAAQTTFIYVMRSLQRGVEPEFELAWLLKIAFNVCRGTRRSAGRATAVTQDVEDIDELAAPPAAGYEGSERLAALRDALAHLPENQQRGILLREWQGLSYAEIADELGLSLGAVETLLFRARRNLASRLEHVRSSGVGAFNVASLAPFVRSLWRGGLGKLGLVGASASVALIPVVAAVVTPALADGKPDVTLPSAAPAATAARAQFVTTFDKRGAVAPAKAPRARAGSNAPKGPRPLPQAATGAVGAESGSGPTSGAGASLEPPLAATPGAPHGAVPSVQAPTLDAAALPVPQLPGAVPTADTKPLSVLSDALAGLQASLPLP